MGYRMLTETNVAAAARPTITKGIASRTKTEERLLVINRHSSPIDAVTNSHPAQTRSQMGTTSKRIDSNQAMRKPLRALRAQLDKRNSPAGRQYWRPASSKQRLEGEFFKGSL